MRHILWLIAILACMLFLFTISSALLCFVTGVLLLAVFSSPMLGLIFMGAGLMVGLTVLIGWIALTGQST